MVQVECGGWRKSFCVVARNFFSLSLLITSALALAGCCRTICLQDADLMHTCDPRRGRIALDVCGGEEGGRRGLLVVEHGGGGGLRGQQGGGRGGRGLAAAGGLAGRPCRRGRRQERVAHLEGARHQRRVAVHRTHVLQEGADRRVFQIVRWVNALD